MKQNRNIHILPTDKPSRLAKSTKSGLNAAKKGKGLYESGRFGITTFNIYITSDEEIKERDWVKNISFEEPIFKLDGKGITYVTLVPHLKFNKIILTTDQALIAEGIQQIDNEFLEWFVKNPSCEEVEIKQVADLDLYYKNGIGGQKYKIIIPKEERSYSEQDLKNAFLDGWQLRDGDLPFPKAKKKWFNEFKNK